MARALLLLVLVFCAGFMQVESAPRKVAPSPCSSPFQACDFYFARNKAVVPTVTLKAAAGNQIIISNPIVHKSGNVVQTAQTSSCTFAGTRAQCTLVTFLGSNPNQVTNVTNLVGLHPLTKLQLRAYKNRCAVLRMDNLYVAGTWVNLGDGKRAYPQARRCVVFKTL